MRREVITYRDIVTGKEITKPFYFNLTETEFAEMNFDIDGGFEELIKSMDDNPNQSYIIKVFKTLLGKAVCEKTPDGKRYVKSDDITNEFLGSDAYSKLFIKLAFTDDHKYTMEFLADTIMDFDRSVLTQMEKDPNYIDNLRKQKVESIDVGQSGNVIDVEVTPVTGEDNA